MSVNIDFMNIAGQSQGELARYLVGNGRFDPGTKKPWFNPADGRSYITVYKGTGDPLKKESYHAVPLQGNATLRYDDWKAFDDVALEISRTRLGGIQDLVDNKLVYNIGNGMGTMVLQGTTSSDAMEADLSMNGKAKSQGDRINYENTYLPLPICHADFRIDSRVIQAARQNNHPIDTEHVATAVRKVYEKLEQMLFTDTSYTFGGGTIYSYLNEPNRNAVTLSLAWDNASKTAAQILTDVFNMKQASINAKHYGPWMLYIPTAYEIVLDKDYDSTTPGKTIRARILEIANIKGIKVVDTLTANNVLLVQMTSDVVRLVQGMAVQTIEWKTGDMFENYYKVMTIQVPQVRADQDGNSGIVRLS